MEPIALYIHIPFCIKKCTYCDFCSIPVPSKTIINNYINGVIREIKSYYPHIKQYKIDTVYFGGGTPSSINPSHINRILKAIRESKQLEDHAEITLEVNPGTVSKSNLETYRSLGINRLSIGAQSFIDNELALLGRIHTVDDIHKAYTWSRSAGFNNISLDLIYGLPGQKMHSLTYSLEEIIALSPEHISTYSLTIEKSTPIFKQVLSGSIPDINNTLQAKMFTAIMNRLKKSSYTHYEISNFSARGFHSIHNTGYWTGKEYIGVGVGAHSNINHIRYNNSKNIATYVAHARKRKEPTLSETKQFWEKIILGLRIIHGIQIDNIPATCHTYEQKIASLVKKKLITCENNKLRLTKKGILFYDEIAVTLI